MREPFSRTDVAAYLHFGYLPRVPDDYRELPWSRVRPVDVRPATERERPALVAEGVEVFRRACARAEPGTHVVPLSGGVDSRLILAALLAAGLRERIVAVTFGIPGTYDFEIAARVAEVANVRHEALDLTGLAMTREELLDSARRAPGSFVLESHYNHLAFLRFGPSVTYWSGNMANAMAGADLEVDCADWPSACRVFAEHTRAARTLVLTPPGFRAETVLPPEPLLGDSCLSGYEQLFLYLRYPGRNDPAMFPPGFAVRAPFRSPGWVDFMLRVPAAFRRGGGFYRAIAMRTGPELFALPLKNCLGFALGTPSWRVALRRARLKGERALAARFPRGPWRTNPKLNYADFDAELRSDTPLRAVVEDSLARLARRQMIDWVDPLSIWKRHVDGRSNHGDALVVLASLELNLALEEVKDD